MLRGSAILLGSKTPKPTVRYDLIPRRSRVSKIKLSRNSIAAAGETGTATSGEAGTTSEKIMGQGSFRKTVADDLKSFIDKLDHPVVWVWYPWRRKPEPPLASFPCPNALKNLHGAVYGDLTPTQKKRHEEMHFTTIPKERQEKHDQRHPFLASIMQDLKGAPKGFPFWYKKYPTRRHAYETRFNIPKEMLEGYSPEIQAAVSSDLMSVKELEGAERAKYIERYATDDLDTTSPAVTCVNLALRTRNLRNHLIHNPHNNIIKRILFLKENQLARALRRLRKIDFKQYWEICNDHDVGEMIQPKNYVSYKWGQYWNYDWNNGLAISTNIADFMDPRGLNGCVETGRSRAEVARDLGLTYTRPLNPGEKALLSHNAKYFERLSQFKMTNPAAYRKKSHDDFVRKFSSMFAKVNKYTTAVDFPSKYRGMIGNTVLRWKSARHGPM